jgi:hypothetical protein
LDTAPQEVKFVAQRELLSDCLAEIEPILEEHWLELARNKNIISLDPDFPKYLALEKAGIYRLYVVRDKSGEMAGYAGFIVGSHLHYKTDIWALADLFFVRPKFRSKRQLGLNWRNRPKGAGRTLFEAAEADLTAIKCSVVHVTYKIANPAAGIMLKQLGYTPIETGCAKVLK